MGTPTMHRAKTAQPRVRMEGWRQRRPGSNGRNPQKGKEKKEKKHLTHTGLLMEGICRWTGDINGHLAEVLKTEPEPAFIRFASLV